MQVRKVLLCVIVALVVLVAANGRNAVHAESPDPLTVGKQPRGSFGYDISFPQCPAVLPSAPFSCEIDGPSV